MFPRLQRGFGIIAAIMILLILAVLAAAIALLASNQAVGSALDVQGTKAYVAAQSGVEWGLYQAIKASSCVASTDLAAIDGITVTVTCVNVASGNTVEAGLGNVYRITATACNTPIGTTCPGNTANSNYVERRITVLTEI